MNKVREFKKRDIQRQYLRNGDLKISEGTKRKWRLNEITIDLSFDGVYSLDSNGWLVYEPAREMDLYGFINIDTTPQNLVANIPFRLENKVQISLDSNGNLNININN